MANDLSLALRLFLESRGFNTGMSEAKRNLTGFTGGFSRSISVLSGGLDRISGRYSALLTGFVGLQAVRGVAALQDRIVALGDEASLTAEQMAALKQEVFDVSRFRAA
jgi:hypothetical protein